MDITPLVVSLPLFVLALIAPGPDFVFVSSVALRHGRRQGVEAAAGIELAISIYCAMSVMGLAILLEQSPYIAAVVRVLGGGYLIYIGCCLWRVSMKKVGGDDGVGVAGRRNFFVAGLLTNLTNPKAIAFFSSVYAVALQPGAPGEVKALLVFGSALLAFGWFSFVSFVLAVPRVGRGFRRQAHWIDRVAGTALAFFGGKLVWGVVVDLLGRG